MKQGIHPVSRPTVFIDVSTNDQIITTSTIQSAETMDINGVTHQVIRTDITSFSHPFFTGEMRFVDQKGRVDGFLKKMQVAQAKQAAQKGKKKVEQTPEETKSYQELLREQQSALRKQKTTSEN